MGKMLIFPQNSDRVLEDFSTLFTVLIVNMNSNVLNLEHEHSSRRARTKRRFHIVLNDHF